jgi:hypothetical protein
MSSEACAVLVNVQVVFVFAVAVTLTEGLGVEITIGTDQERAAGAGDVCDYPAGRNRPVITRGLPVCGLRRSSSSWRVAFSPTAPASSSSEGGTPPPAL